MLLSPGPSSPGSWASAEVPDNLPLLVFDAPRRGRPPRHFVDLEPGERAAALEQLGYPAFRADQIARQYFGRLSADPLDWTDLPKDMRESISGVNMDEELTRMISFQHGYAAIARFISTFDEMLNIIINQMGV